MQRNNIKQVIWRMLTDENNLGSKDFPSLVWTNDVYVYFCLLEKTTTTK